MRLPAADLRKCAGIEALAAEVDQGVRAALAARRLIVGLKWVLASADCGTHDGATFRVELAIDHEYAVQGLADMQITALVVFVVGGERAVGVLAVADGPGDVAETLGLAALRGLEEGRLLACDRLHADLGDRVGDHRSVVESDLTRR
jgi:hypothetical protein